MMQEGIGIIKTLAERGYGFISADFSESDIFFHAENLLGVTFAELQCGDAVFLEAGARSERGRVAYRVERMGSPVELSSRHELTAQPPTVFVRALQECTTELVQHLEKHPDDLRNLHAGTFENLVAEIFRHEGFETERISGWNEPDGGVDLIAVRHLAPEFDIRLAIQCKRWSQSRRLSAEPLRTLAGVLDRFRAHAGVVATTGIFSVEAEEERTDYLWRISLRDYDDILASLKRMNLTQ
jgi:restriction endonuclease Mrr